METPSPVAQLRIANITAAIRENEAHNGARYNVTFRRSVGEGKASEKRRQLRTRRLFGYF